MKLWKKRSKGCSTTEKVSFNEQVYITNVRHKEALEQTLDSLKMVKAERIRRHAGRFLLH